MGKSAADGIEIHRILIVVHVESHGRGRYVYLAEGDAEESAVGRDKTSHACVIECFAGKIISSMSNPDLGAEASHGIPAAPAPPWPPVLKPRTWRPLLVGPLGRWSL